ASLLQADGYTPDGDPNRVCQEWVKNALDAANSDQNFVQSSPCPFKYSGTLATTSSSSRSGDGVATDGGSPDAGVQLDASGSSVEMIGVQSIAPNPFTQSTMIQYAVKTSGERVQIAIYNVAGRMIRNLLDRTADAGTHVVAWDGTNEAGVKMTPGVYFVRSRISGLSQVQRV